MHQTNDASGDEVLAVGTATARIESAGSDGSREVQVREDAVVNVP